MELLIAWLPILTAVLTGLSWYAAYVGKRTAQMRDMQSLINCYERMESKMEKMEELIDRRIDHLERQVIEIKTAIAYALNKGL